MKENKDNLHPINTITPFKRFCMTIGELPASYLETMSYYEMLVWFTKFLQDTVIPTINNNAEAIDELQDKYIEFTDNLTTLFNQLQDYVNNYFDNLDVQEEINNKLDDMVEQGTLQEIIADYLNAKAIFGFDNVDALKASTNLIDGSYAETMGFYSKNDGGRALYKIRDITNDDVIDNITIIPLDDVENNLIAELIMSHEMNIKQFGLIGDGTDTQSQINDIIDIVINNNITLTISDITLSYPLIIPDNININFNEITYTGNSSALVIKSENGCIINGNKLISSGKGIEFNNEDITTTNGNVKDFNINISYIETNNDSIWLNANMASKGIINGYIKSIVVKSTTGKGIMVNPTAGWVGQINFDITNIQSLTDYAIYLTTANGGSLKGFNFPYLSFEGSKYGLYWNFDTKACEPIFGYFRTVELLSGDTHFKFVGKTSNLTEVSRIKFDRCAPSTIDVSEITPVGHYQWGYIILEGAIRQSANIVSEAIIYSNFLTFTKYPENAVYLSGNSDYEWNYGTKIATMVIPQNTNTFNIYIPKWMGVFSGEFQILIQDATWKNITILSPNGSTILDLSTLTFSANDIIKFKIIDADQHEKIIWWIESKATYPKNFNRVISD